MELIIEEKPFASTHNYAGVYTDSNNKEYGFNIVESVNVDLAQCGVEEIVWVDSTPENHFEIEIQILLEFKSVCDD